MSFALPWLGHDPQAPFPPVAQALREPDGLLAAGGDLSPERLLHAYRAGIFPWFSEGQPILWWSPDPRLVFATDAVHLSRRFRRSLRQSTWIARADTAFDTVVAACAQAPRAGQRGTWISDDMRAAYGRLHRLGHAHSVEVFDRDDLVGGIYGVAIGRMFFGESMFSARSGGSRVALAALARRLDQWGWPLIDAQVENPHLLRMGARPLAREAFLARIGVLVGDADSTTGWSGRFGEFPARELAA
ncbi:leucyl/phenylalanyl-tRNA--protein transferase [Cognatiluteimonas telluris]|uniref:leucyl/phenylalanyl-tRNA--protein transferase n=1 Tax=Cognatiluteimonas telluris TaxID=1104775 RepID=UPI00140C0DB7|nr:leucyl/phenylalanyl-tRNA--protein transferase [Lysobacter telluris]